MGPEQLLKCLQEIYAVCQNISQIMSGMLTAALGKPIAWTDVRRWPNKGHLQSNASMAGVD